MVKLAIVMIYFFVALNLLQDVKSDIFVFMCIRLRLVTWAWQQLWGRTTLHIQFLGHQNSWHLSCMKRTTLKWLTYTHLECVC